MIDLKNIKIGSRIWAMGYWSNIPESGIVQAVKYTDPTPQHLETIPYVEVTWDNGGTSSAKLNEIYSSFIALQKGEKEREDKAVAEIKAKIHNVKELVAFMYNASLNSGEYTNYDEKRAARELAKELLGLDLE